jgi:hypothetical protein
MNDEFPDGFGEALDKNGYPPGPAIDSEIGVMLDDVQINGIKFDRVEMMVYANGDELSFGVMDVWRSDNNITEEHERVFDEVGRSDDGGAVFEIDSIELDNYDKITSEIQSIYTEARE